MVCAEILQKKTKLLSLCCVSAICVLAFSARADELLAQDLDSMLPEKPIVVIIPSYKNSQWYQKNLDSIVNQKYTNFHIIYLDDCSPDGTGQLVENYIKERHLENKITLIRNKVRRGALANIYTAMHMCDDWAIAITVDGDDWAKHDRVLARVNEEYTQRGAWMTYGFYEIYPFRTEPFKEMPRSIIANNTFREWDWVSSHLRTCYAWLFKQIKLQDLFFEGNFFDVTGDLAQMFPMLEMAAERGCQISDVLYVYNCATTINDFKTKLVRQIHCDKVIRSMQKYSRLKNVPADVGVPLKSSAQGIVFSEDNPMRLEACLESLQAQLRSTNRVNIAVLYRAGDSSLEKEYQRLEKKFDTVRFVLCNPQTLKVMLLDVVQKAAADYLFFAYDDMVLKDMIDLDMCARLLKKTHAHGMYCSLGNNATRNIFLARSQMLPPAVWIEGDVWAWQFKDGEQDWRMPYALNMAFYRTADMAPVLEAARFADFASLERACDKMRFDMNKVGLFFQTAKAGAITP